MLVDATAASPSAALPDWLAVCGLTGELTIACSRPAEGKQVEDESGAGSREQLKAALIGQRITVAARPLPRLRC